MKEFGGFYRKSIEERQKILAEKFKLTREELGLLKKEGPLDLKTADGMIENVVGTFPLPFGVAANFVVDGKEYVVPFALEEPSVVAAASNAAKLSEGFETEADEPIMIGQIQLINMFDAEEALKKIMEKKEEILGAAKEVDPVLVKFGGGPRDLKGTVLETERGQMIDLHLLVDVRDAMGANAINTMLEKITEKVEEISEGEHVARIISNLAIYRKARAKTVWKKRVLEESLKGEMRGEDIIERIMELCEFAKSTQFRTATHNKGIMNGIDAVIIATGNDFRAAEAGAHAYACHEHEYQPLTKYSVNEAGDLVGEIELPLALGLVGGATKTHPLAQLSLKILGVKTAQDLARIIAAVGLAQNFAALRAIATTGIQSGHMKLHAKNIAIQAGAGEEEADEVVKKMIGANNVSQAKAEEILGKLRKGK